MGEASIEHTSADSYIRSGFSARMGWGARPALLLIDVACAYWTPGSPLDLSSYEPATKAPDSMRRLLSAARKGGVPVIWTKVQYQKEGDMKDAGLFYHKARMLTVWQDGDDRNLGAWMSGLEPRDDELVVVKQYPSAFFETNLKALLLEKGVDTVVICGVSTSGCVRASALDAMCNGFRPMIVGEACGDRSAEIHNSNLFDLDAKYADVVSKDSASEKLSSGWH